MIEIAQLHKDELERLVSAVWFEDRYKYWNSSVYYGQAKVEDNTWNTHQFVSVDKKGNVIGYIDYSIDRESDRVYGLGIINFTDDIITFGLDLRQVLDDIFRKFNFRKLCYAVVCGNPIEKSYDRMTEKYGGRVVGICRQEVRLMDGILYDLKKYEIFRTDYLRKFNL